MLPIVTGSGAPPRLVYERNFDSNVSPVAAALTTKYDRWLGTRRARILNRSPGLARLRCCLHNTVMWVELALRELNSSPPSPELDSTLDGGVEMHSRRQPRQYFLCTGGRIRQIDWGSTLLNVARSLNTAPGVWKRNSPIRPRTWPSSEVVS
jgi:hypothetical protein